MFVHDLRQKFKICHSEITPQNMLKHENKTVRQFELEEE